MHRLLQRQLKRTFGKNFDFDAIDKNLLALFEEISNTYSEYDNERRFLEHTLSLNSDELNSANKKLAQSNVELEKKIKIELEKNLQQEMQLYEQSKMVSMGEMIGNIAHQWRQPLSAITASNSALQVNRLAGIDDDESFNSLTSHIKKNAEYLSETIDIFRDFIKENKELKEQVVQERIQKALDIVKATFNDYHIELIKSIINTPIVIAMPSGELDQVLINIFNNAKDVIKEKSIKNPWVKLDVYRENENLIISIEDNAGGIPEKVMGKIFEPYFTTKHKSQGTGLGLHMSYKIITETFGGKLYAKNTKHGAKFFIEIPLNCGINI